MVCRNLFRYLISTWEMITVSNCAWKTGKCCFVSHFRFGFSISPCGICSHTTCTASLGKTPRNGWNYWQRSGEWSCDSIIKWDLKCLIYSGRCIHCKSPTSISFSIISELTRDVSCKQKSLLMHVLLEWEMMTRLLKRVFIFMIFFRQSRTTFDNADTRKEFGPIVIDYGKVREALKSQVIKTSSS